MEEISRTATPLSLWPRRRRVWAGGLSDRALFDHLSASYAALSGRRRRPVWAGLPAAATWPPRNGSPLSAACQRRDLGDYAAQTEPTRITQLLSGITHSGVSLVTTASMCHKMNELVVKFIYIF